MNHKVLLPSLLAIVLITAYSCIKEDSTDCKPPSLTVSANTPIKLGDSLVLHVNSIYGATYHWTGPASYSSDQQNPMIYNMGSANAGKYTVQVTVPGGCVNSATTDSVIVTVPPAPCSPSTNTASIQGSTDISFHNVSVGPSSSDPTYLMTGHGTAGDFEFEFASKSKPTPGVYNVQPQTGFLTYGQVTVNITTTGGYWASSTGKVYVTVNNNKLTATVCNLAVSSLVYGFKTTASGSITEP